MLPTTLHLRSIFHPILAVSIDVYPILQPLPFIRQTHTHTHTLTHTHTHTHTRTHKYTQRYTHTYTHIQTHTHTHTNIQTLWRDMPIISDLHPVYAFQLQQLPYNSTKISRRLVPYTCIGKDAPVNGWKEVRKGGRNGGEGGLRDTDASRQLDY